MRAPSLAAASVLAILATVLPATANDLAWSSWRGPQQNGTSMETALPSSWSLDGTEHQWTVELSGRGTPVVHDGRVYTLGYRGEGPDLSELLVCLDEETGSIEWEIGTSDFVSDSIYTRYAIGSPTIDPETGNLFWMTTPGLLSCASPDGEVLWRRSMMEEFGRLTFPNGRTGSVLIDGPLAIARGITSAWGKLGPARDRFYAFDKSSGELVWISTPGTGPKDSCFSLPILEWRDGRRLMYTGTGCGNVVCIDARTGDPVWRFPFSIGGVNSSVLLHGDRLLAIHGRENLDSSIIGRMVAIELGAEPAAGEAGPVILDESHELWRNDLGAFTSSPVLVGDRIYETIHTGDLCCVDATTGEILWHEKLAPDQIHASPVYGDGKLYVPMTNGSFFIVEPSDRGPTILSTTQLEGNCLGAPAISAGRIFVHTTEKLYCFGRSNGTSPHAIRPSRPSPSATEPVALMCEPREIRLKPGERMDIRTRSVDADGNPVVMRVPAPTWTVPPTLDARMEGSTLIVADDARPGAGHIAAAYGEMTGDLRVRIMPDIPCTYDFNDTNLNKMHAVENVAYAFPPGPWLSATKKWEVREVDGEKMLAKALDNPLFQRSQSFIGHPENSSYTMQLDMMSDGNRRSMSSAGMVNQRYLIVLKGNHQQLEISSNQERIKHAVPFRWKAKNWYTLKSRVDMREDGSALVRAKVWPRDEAEPADWTIEFTHTNGHANGAPGLYSFTPQSRFRVYVDNITVTPNE